MNHIMNHRILPLICYPSVTHIERNFPSAVSKMQMKFQTVLNEPEVCYNSARYYLRCIRLVCFKTQNTYAIQICHKMTSLICHAFSFYYF